MIDQNDSQMSAEQAADLNRLMAGAAEPEAEQQQQVLAEQEEAQLATSGLAEQNAKALEVLVSLAGPTLGAFGFPSVERVLNTVDGSTGSTKGQMLAHVWSAVLAKHGVDLGELGGQWKEEIAAVFVTLPIGAAIYKGILSDCRPADAPAPAVAAPQATALRAVPVDGVAVVHP